MQKIICLSLLLFVAFCAFGQTDRDSLLNKWQERQNEKHDSADVDLLIEIVKSYQYDHSDSALYYTELASSLAAEIAYPRGRARAAIRRGVTYYIMSSYELAMKAYLEALELNREVNDLSGIAYCLNGIGLVYLGRDDYERAIDYQKQSLAYSTRGKDSVTVSNNYFNIGLAYDELGIYDSAHLYLERAIDIASKARNFQTRAMATNRLGETSFHQGNYDEAIGYYRAVLNDITYQSNWEKAFAYSGLAQVYLKVGDPQKAIAQGRLGLEYAQLVGANWDIKRALEILAEAYALEGDFESAFQTHKAYKLYSDSILNEAKEQEMNFLMLRQKEAENKQLIQENEIKEEKLKINRLIIVMFVVVLTFVLTIAIIIAKNSHTKTRFNQRLTGQNESIAGQKALIQEQNRKLEELNKNQALILSIISHDMRSPIASIQSMIELLKSGSEHTWQESSMIDELERRIHNVATMLNNLLHWAGTQFSGITVSFREVNVTEMVAQLFDIYRYQAAAKGVKMEHRGDGEAILYADESQLRIILQNLISNAIKFTPGGGLVTVFYSKRDDLTLIHVKDTGVGMSAGRIAAINSEKARRLTEPGTDNEPGTGIGLLLVKQFVEGNNGLLKIHSEPGKGTEFIVGFSTQKPG